MLIAIIEEAGLEDLLMESCTVEARLHRKKNVFFQSFRRGGGVDPVWIETLIQNETLEDGYAVDEEAVTVQPELPQTEIAFYRVFPEGEGKIIEIALPRSPEMGFRKGNDDKRRSIFRALAEAFPQGRPSKEASAVNTPVPSTWASITTLLSATFGKYRTLLMCALGANSNQTVCQMPVVLV